MIVQSQIQKRLSEAIRQSGMSQTEIAEKIQISQQMISNTFWAIKCRRWTRLQIYVPF